MPVQTQELSPPIRQNIYVSLSPNVFAQCASVSSNDSNAPLAVRYINGNITTEVANIADHHVMVRRIPNDARNHLPIMRFGPSMRSNRYPATVGGRTNGRVRTTSSTAFTGLGALAVQYAEDIPAKNTIAVLMPAILTEFQSG